MNITIADIGKGYSRLTLTDDSHVPVRTHVYNCPTADCEAFKTRLEQRMTDDQNREGIDHSPTRTFWREMGDPKAEQIDRGRRRES